MPNRALLGLLDTMAREGDALTLSQLSLALDSPKSSLLLMLLAGCQSDRLTPTTGTGHSPLVCSQWVPITYASKHDTPETVQQVRVNNAKRGAYCG